MRTALETTVILKKKKKNFSLSSASLGHVAQANASIDQWFTEPSRYFRHLFLLTNFLTHPLTSATSHPVPQNTRELVHVFLLQLDYNGRLGYFMN